MSNFFVHVGQVAVDLLASTSRTVSPTCSDCLRLSVQIPNFIFASVCGTCKAFSGCLFPIEDFLELPKVFAPDATPAFCSPVRGIDLHLFARLEAASVLALDPPDVCSDL